MANLPRREAASEIRPVAESEAGSRRWYLVVAQPHNEVRALTNLDRQGFEAFLPVYRTTVRHARKIRTVKAPLFPRYLFCRFDVLRDPWSRVRSSFGVSCLLMSGERPLAVPHGVVEGLQDSVDGEGLVRLDDGLQVGRRVRLMEGPFVNLVGVLHRLDDHGRVSVLLDIMGSTIPVRLHRRALAAAD